MAEGALTRNSNQPESGVVVVIAAGDDHQVIAIHAIDEAMGIVESA